MSSASDLTMSFWTEHCRRTMCGQKRPLNWWDMPVAAREQGKLAFPDTDAADSLATIRLLRSKVAPGVLGAGLSIGCGSAHKELQILKANLVSHFMLIDIVPELLDIARAAFQESGYACHGTFSAGNYREIIREKSYDLVYFDNSLMHMYDIEDLLDYLISIMHVGGFFVMDDFVGPSFMQFSDQFYEYADHVRRLLPESFFEGEDRLASQVDRITVHEWLNTDPSMACDSSSILPAMANLMPGVEITPTGGLVYFLACRGVFGRLVAHPDRDDAIIRLLFELDRVLVRADPNLTCYALAIWQKPPDYRKSDFKQDWRQSIRWRRTDIPVHGSLANPEAVPASPPTTGRGVPGNPKSA